MMVESLSYFVTLLHKDFFRFCSQKLTRMKLTRGQLYFLIYIGKHPACSPKELARELNMDVGHTARSLVKLEQGGFLKQTSNPKDRRSHMLNLTQTGEEAFRLSRELFTQWDQRVLVEFTPEEQAQLLSMLQRLISLEENIPQVRHQPLH